MPEIAIFLVIGLFFPIVSLVAAVWFLIQGFPSATLILFVWWLLWAE